MITGTVRHVDKKDWKNGIFLHHFLLEGSPKVYNCGAADPEVQPGEHIKFAEVNRKVDTSTIARISEGEVVEAPKPEAPVPSRTPVGATSNGADVGLRIQRQAARHDAIRLVCVAMENKLLPYPQSGKNEDKWARLLDLINETTSDLLEMEEEWTTRS